jgi:hypothetical protein
MAEIEPLKASFLKQADELEAFGKLVKAKNISLDPTSYAEVLKQTAFTARISYAYIKKLEDLQLANTQKDCKIKELEEAIRFKDTEIKTLNEVKKHFEKIASILAGPSTTSVSVVKED